jgi:enoyl-CoA hydratase/carnithine racemase
MGFQTIVHEFEDGVATLTLNRPERLNAWNDAMAAELREAMQRCDEDDAVRAVVLTGAGRAFCAGADLASGADTFQRPPEAGSVEDPRQLARRWGGYAGPFPWQIRKPVIAAINGHAIGVGITYPLTCDIRFVAEDAKIQFAFVRRGVLPELWSHWIAARVAGLSNAADLLLSGRVIRGREFAALGLASAALPAHDVLPAARERAREFRLAAPASVALSKRLLWQGLGASIEAFGPLEARAFRFAAGQPDAREGVVAFLEKREPTWQGRASDVPVFDPGRSAPT